MTIARLNYLRNMLSKYTTAYYKSIDSGKGLSSRMYGWIDEYNDARYCRVWMLYCRDSGCDPMHNAYDLFA
jgi:hypothetical protein